MCLYDLMSIFECFVFCNISVRERSPSFSERRNFNWRSTLSNSLREGGKESVHVLRNKQGPGHIHAAPDHLLKLGRVERRSLQFCSDHLSSFPRPAIAKYHTLGASKQHQLIIWQIWRLSAQTKVPQTWFPLRAPSDTFSCLFPGSGEGCQSLAFLSL